MGIQNGASKRNPEVIHTKRETEIQNRIRAALCEFGCVVHRCNTGVFYTKDGRPIKIGEVGHSDLYGHNADGTAFYLEVKTPVGKASRKQIDFIEAMARSGAIAGFARTVEDAVRIVTGIRISKKEPVFNDPVDMEEVKMCLNCDSPTCNGDCEKVKKNGRWRY